MFMFLVKGVMLLAGASWLWTNPGDLGLDNLRSFAKFTTLYGGQVGNVSDLPVQGVKDYTSAACVAGAGHEQTREELEAQLQQVPSVVRVQVLDQALPIGQVCPWSVTNTLRVSDSDRFTLSSFYGMWNTTCDAGSNYQSCVLISGSSVHVAEEMVVGVQKNRTLKHLGTRPCDCVLSIFCKTCPVVEEVEIEALVTRSRDPLTLRQHRELHAMLIGRAEQLGTALIESSSYAQLQITAV